MEEQYFVIIQEEQIIDGKLIIEHTIHHADTYLKNNANFEFHSAKNKPYSPDDIISIIKKHNISRFEIDEIHRKINGYIKDLRDYQQIAIGTYSYNGKRDFLLMRVPLHPGRMFTEEYLDVFDQIFTNFTNNKNKIYSILTYLECTYGKPNVEAFYKLTNFESSLNQAIKDARSPFDDEDLEHD